MFSIPWTCLSHSLSFGSTLRGMGVANLWSNQQKCASESVNFFRFLGLAKKPRNRSCLSGWTKARIAPCSCSADCSPFFTRSSYLNCARNPREQLTPDCVRITGHREPAPFTRRYAQARQTQCIICSAKCPQLAHLNRRFSYLV